MWTLAAPLARLRVPPTTVTALGAVSAVAAAVTVVNLSWLALVLILAAALCDGIDGAIAVLRDRPGWHGRIADAMADRIADTAFAAVLWRCGAPWWLAAAAAVASLGQESVRRSLGGVGHPVITVAERPTRVICAVVGAFVAGLTATPWPQTVCAGVWLGLAVVGFAQLLERRR